MQKEILVDPLGRRIRYLRLSITDRCNFRCQYCKVDNSFIEHDQVLRYEELLSIAKVASDLGVEKIRLTGGEPFVRKGFVDFLLRLHTQLPHLDLRITSNGTLLKEHIPTLKACGIHTLNISLDTFNPELFAQITGADKLNDVLSTIDALLDAQIKVKINVVALKNVNEQELKQFLDFAYQKQVDVRFIEFMPMGEGSRWTKDNFWSAEDILRQAQKLYSLTLIPQDHLEAGPAKLYSINNSQAHLGLITPLTNHYCESCNRLRVTSDGKLRTCLFDDHEYKLAPILRHKKLGAKYLYKIFQEANKRKPLGNNILVNSKGAVAKRGMRSIGG